MELINLYFIPIIFVWTMGTFFKKQFLQYMNALELMYLNHVIYSFFFLVGFFYILFNKKTHLVSAIKNYNKIPFYLYLIMITNIFMSFYSFYAGAVLLKKYDVSYFLPIVRAGSSILILIVGYFIYKEKVTTNKLIGFLFIMIGIFIMNTNSNIIKMFG